MNFDRRALLAGAGSLLASSAAAQALVGPLTTFESQSGGRIGLYAENIDTGRSIAWRAQERFVMCSTFKASLAACILSRVDLGQERLEAMIPYGPSDIAEYAPAAKENLSAGAMSIDAMCRASVELSDNTCANLLLARIGGPPALTRFWRAIGDPVTRLDHNEPLLNRSPPGDPHDTTTPMAMAGNVRRLLLEGVLSEVSRERLKGWMVGCKTGANRLRAGLPKSWVVGDKTGNNGKDAAGDIAMLWRDPKTRIVACAYTQGGAPTTAQIDQVFAAIGPMMIAGL